MNHCGEGDYQVPVDHDLTFSTNTTFVVEKAQQQQLHSLWRLRKVGVPAQHHSTFYRDALESVWECWFGNSTGLEKHQLSRILETTSNITSSPIPGRGL